MFSKVPGRIVHCTSSYQTKNWNWVLTTSKQKGHLNRIYNFYAIIESSFIYHLTQSLRKFSRKPNGRDLFGQFQKQLKTSHRSGSSKSLPNSNFRRRKNGTRSLNSPECFAADFWLYSTSSNNYIRFTKKNTTVRLLPLQHNTITFLFLSFKR